MEKVNKILFITPTLERTGSEIVLYNLINAIDKKFQFSILSIYKGKLYDGFNADKSYLLSERSNTFLGRIQKKIAFSITLPLKLYKNRNCTWYINTIVLTHVLKYAKKYNVKCIIHTHELDHMFSLLGKEDKENLITAPYLVIANSGQSSKVFEKNGYNKAMEICYPFIDSKKYAFDKEKYNSTRSTLNLSNTNFTWLMCGTIDQNKNPELFIQIAEHFFKTKPGARFIWLGDNTDNPEYKNKCLQKSKHLTNLTWVHEKGEKYIDYINACDGFVLSSQFESFSIVTLEALALGKPVVANDCQGVSEIINSDDIGIIINEKNNLQKFCEQITLVMDGKKNINTQKAIDRSRQFDINISVNKWNSILNKYINE
ncbi:MAG: glycosyltransferase [Bacteroidia bacterium]